MPLYAYKARDRSGRLVEAVMEAPTQRDVALALREKDLLPTEIAPPKTGLHADVKLPAWLSVGGKPNLRDVTVFSRQFATVINAGLPVVQSLAILQRQAEKDALKEALKRIREEVETGTPLSEALAKHPKLFGRLYVYLVRAGEASGNLDSILERIALYQEKQAALRGKLRSALTYPTVVLLIALGVTYFLLTGIVPQFAGILTQLGGELPLMTRVLIAISDFLRGQWWLLLLLAVGGVVGLGAFYRTARGRRAIDGALLKAPVLGKLVQKTAIASFSSTFGLLLKSGVNILEAIDITKGTAGNAIVEDVLEEAKGAVQRGEQMSLTLLARPKVFPPLVASMVAIGEETGAVDAMMEKVASFYEREVNEAVESLTAALEPLLIVFLGGVVGFIVAGMFLPMFAIIGQLGG
ncbi:type II secretion system F family protein [Truepera radiovictrix]|uniref:Type II secretion system F domain protein n=1 Tax=Truepera radiovictrix (strain DSM 17093 / CIP 108686 / LMG 22925 / RQ-24) TaxID=649638 RepID=D7CU00_TRURR|nr:type II secretion system F family protein [Truepera radiovictrix]ADI13898.1 Type II secretion system F domain protein [Truepera radiovictrix DSM 17093]WMT57538.1 type II secretion system F family protein [Truepera radiovictrix]